MIPEIGQFALSLALCLTLIGGALGIGGAVRGNEAWMAVARPVAAGQLVFVAIAFACLTHAFVTNDFSVANVAANSNLRLPLEYRVAAVWGSHEGSLLLWVLMLAGWTAAVARTDRRRDGECSHDDAQAGVPRGRRSDVRGSWRRVGGDCTRRRSDVRVDRQDDRRPGEA